MLWWPCPVGACYSPASAPALLGAHIRLRTRELDMTQNSLQLQLHSLHSRRARRARAAGRHSRSRCRPHTACTAPRPAAPWAPSASRTGAAAASQPNRCPPCARCRPAAATAGAAAQPATGGGRSRAGAGGTAGLSGGQLHARLALHPLQQVELGVLGCHRLQGLQHAARRLLDLHGAWARKALNIPSQHEEGGAAHARSMLHMPAAAV